MSAPTAAASPDRPECGGPDGCPRFYHYSIIGQCCKSSPASIGCCGGEEKKFDPQWVRRVEPDGTEIWEWV